MYTQITGIHENKPAITVQFYDTGISLLYLEGAEPFARYGLALEKAQQVIVKAGYSIKIEKIS